MLLWGRKTNLHRDGEFLLHILLLIRSYFEDTFIDRINLNDVPNLAQFGREEHEQQDPGYGHSGTIAPNSSSSVFLLFASTRA